MMRVGRKVMGLVLIGAGVAWVFLLGFISHRFMSVSSLLVFAPTVAFLGFGGFLLRGDPFFPDREDPEQPQWRDDEAPPR